MGSTDVAETHVSRVFFTDDRAYKLLKPVSLGFVDFSDRSARLDAARRELELNRRFAPDVYLGLADVWESDELVDRMIVMRRLPPDRRLEVLLARRTAAAAVSTSRSGTIPDEVSACLTAVARTVAAIHMAAPALTAGPGTVTRDDVARNWEDNFAAISPHVGAIIDPTEHAGVQRLARDYLWVNDELFARRVEEGWIRDGHGDLRAEDVFCLEDGPRILDCLAFSDDLRISDVLADIAFLAMDAHRLSGREAADELMAAYHRFTNETHPSSLARHYVAYRAHVRVKVACMAAAQGNRSKAAEARELHRLVLDQLRLAQPAVVMVGGAPGTGKSTVARHLSSSLGLALVSSDEIRKELAGLGHLESGAAAPGEGIYSDEMGDRVYREMVRQADLLLVRGEPVVLDASWARDGHRELVRAVADRHRARLVEIECRLDREAAKQRVATRTGDPSDATPEVVDHLADRADAWPQAAELDTGRSPGEVGARAAELAQPVPADSSRRSAVDGEDRYPGS